MLVTAKALSLPDHMPYNQARRSKRQLRFAADQKR
jgi:hypothetical protein